ncbi:MAG: FG-GAP-like repeat-containing protein [Bacteroidota bacterium]
MWIPIHGQLGHNWAVFRHRHGHLVCFALSLFYFTAVCAQNFTEASAAFGIAETYGSGLFGGGISVVDFSGDGLDDISICTGSGDELRFFVNQGNGTFAPFTSPILNTQEVKEINWVDFDNDGDMDLFFTVNNGINRLVRNDFGSFQDITTQAFGINPDTYSTFGCDWGDYDLDGDLDLFVCNRQISQEDQLWRNNGSGTFTDVTSSALMGNADQLSFDAVFADLNQDGWPDIYIAVDRDIFLNVTYINQGDGTFISDETNGANIGIDAMNAGGADYDNDGDYDLYVTHTGPGNALLQNDGTGQFSDVASSTGTGVFRYTWSSTFFDLDNDTDQDLYVSASNNPGFNGTNACLINIGGGVFFEPFQVTGGLGGIDNKNTFSHAVGDFDLDGRLDIVNSQMAPDSIMLWHNQDPAGNNYLRVGLSGTVSNNYGIGATIRMYLPGGIQMIRYVECSNGYLSQHSRLAHFGLGNATQIDSIIVEWPSGTVDKLPQTTALNQIIDITEGSFALPLDLLDFSVVGTSAGRSLRWQTDWEQNTSHFVVERSLDGRAFQAIGQLSAAGYSEQVNAYSFLDREELRANECFYRLKMTDADGSFTYSPVRQISLSATGASPVFALVEPIVNPLSDRILRISIRRYLAGELEVKLVDGLGRVLQTNHFAQDEGMHEAQMDLSNWPAGIYWLYLSASGQQEVLPVRLK